MPPSVWPAFTCAANDLITVDNCFGSATAWTWSRFAVRPSARIAAFAGPHGPSHHHRYCAVPVGADVVAVASAFTLAPASLYPTAIRLLLTQSCANGVSRARYGKT